MTAAAFSIGVDFGGTNLRIGAYTQEAGLLETVLLPTRLRDGPGAVSDDMSGGIRRLLGRYSPQYALAGIGVGSPGPLELPAGRLRQPPNLPGWDGFELRATLERTLGTRVLVENDANVAALAEYALGRGKKLGADSLCMLTLGTGLGAGIILHGRIWDGMNGMAGEAGHLNIWTDGVACGCGGHGCLEPYASATAVRRMADERIAGGNAPGLAALAMLNPNFSAGEVAELAVAEDADAKAIYEIVGQSLGIGLASLVNVLNLPLYVLGGGVAASWELFSPALFEELRRRSYVYRLTMPEVSRTELGADAGLLGACLLPFSKEAGHA
ncbi:MAG: ROK family protein [Candidatus Acidiferrales bacterium]